MNGAETEDENEKIMKNDVGSTRWRRVDTDTTRPFKPFAGQMRVFGEMQRTTAEDGVERTHAA